MIVDMLLWLDMFYGVFKVCGEVMVKMYFEKFGVEIVIVWIGFCVEKLENWCVLFIWLSFDDFILFV